MKNQHLTINCRIEDHHVQFKVAPNPANIDAHYMAKRIGEEEDEDTLAKVDGDCQTFLPSSFQMRTAR